MSQSDGVRYNISATAGTTDWDELDKKWAPIMAEMVTLEPGKKQDPVLRQLFNWLVEPQRTGEEYSYVIGELADIMARIMEKYFLKYVYDEMFCINLCKIATEALSARSPILEGPWELAAWTLLMVISDRYGDTVNEYSIESNNFGPWIIRVISDPDLCPNPYLRFEFILLLSKMVDLNDFSPTQVIGSVLSACSCLSSDYLSGNILEYHQTHPTDSVLSAKEYLKDDYLSKKIFEFRKFGERPRDIDDLHDLSNIFEAFAANGHLLEFDKKLVGQLLEVKSSRCSAIVHDVSHRYSMYPSSYAEPRELYGLIALLKSVAGTVETIFKEVHMGSYDKYSILRRLCEPSDFYNVLLTNFKESCASPQLVCLTVSCLKDIRKLLSQMKSNHIDIDDISSYRHIEYDILKLLGDLPDL